MFRHAALWAGLMLAVVAPVSAQDDPRMQEAQAQFRIGQALYEARDFNGALAQFQRVHDMLEGHPRRYFVRFNIAACQEALFRYSAALASYQAYLAESPPDDSRRVEVQQAIQLITTQRTGTIAIQTNVANAEVWIDGYLVGAAPGDILAPIGQHAVELRAHGYGAERQQLTIAAQSRQSARFDLVATFSGLSPVFFFSSVGLTLASAVVASVFGLIALDQRGTLQSRATSSDPRERYQVTSAAIASMQQSALIADVMFSATAVLGVTTVILFFVTDWGSGTSGGSTMHSTSQSSLPSSLRLAPFASPTAAGLSLTGAF